MNVAGVQTFSHCRVFVLKKGEYITFKDTFIFLRSEIFYTLNVKHLRKDMQLLSDWIDASGVSWRVRSN